MRSISRILLLVITAGWVQATAAEPGGDPVVSTDGPLAEIVELEGNVVHIPAGSLRQLPIREPGLELLAEDRLRTLAGASATVVFLDGSEARVLERSLLVLSGQDRSEVGEGRVLFDIQHQGTGGGLTVTSRTVVIGVKGTRFVVDAMDDLTSIFMGQGTVELTPTSGAFRKYREEVLAEFADYRREQLEAYAEFLRERGIDPYEVVERLELKEGDAMLVDGDLLLAIETPEDIAALLAQYRRRAQSNR